MKLAMIAVSLVLAGSAQAQSLKEKYELSERCGKQAAEAFANELEAPGYNSEKAMASYENHYNFQLNKCFYLLTSTGKSETKIMTLFDLNENDENKDYGLYVSTADAKEPIQCYVETNDCHSEAEWRALIKPFMED